MKNKTTFYRIMNGYEFIEFMRKFGWKHNGKYIIPDPDLAKHPGAYYKLSNTRRKFEGWEFWFSRPFPTDILYEETEITYTLRNDVYLFERIEEILLRNGFKVKENN